jgi:hypothetical protein
MGHYCRFCCREWPNEHFSGKGHRQHICKKCQRKPEAEREKLMINEELTGFLFSQSRISKKNRARLKDLMDHPDAELSTKAGLVYDISLIAEGKKRRWKRVKASNRDLFDRCIEFGILLPEEEEEY